MTTATAAARPIPLPTPKVHAIMLGATQLRVLVKPQPTGPCECGPGGEWWDAGTGNTLGNKFTPGDVLYVKETWAAEVVVVAGFDFGGPDVGEVFDRKSVLYRADSWYPEGQCFADHSKGNPKRWRPSIHMPRWAARIFLRIESVRVQRVQEISLKDAVAEGYPYAGRHDPDCVGDNGPCGVEWFARLWNTINAKRGYGMESNPWVWRITFARCDKPEGWG